MRLEGGGVHLTPIFSLPFQHFPHVNECLLPCHLYNVGERLAHGFRIFLEDTVQLDEGERSKAHHAESYELVLQC